MCVNNIRAVEIAGKLHSPNFTEAFSKWKFELQYHKTTTSWRYHVFISLEDHKNNLSLTRIDGKSSTTKQV